MKPTGNPSLDLAETPLIERFIAAVNDEDINLAEVLVAQIGQKSRSQAMNVFGHPKYIPFREAFLELDRLRRAGPVIDDPDSEIDSLIRALDKGDPDQARSIMKSLHASWANNGPRPSMESSKKLVRSFRRPEWDSKVEG